MARKFPIITVAGLAALALATGGALAQSPLDQTQLSDAPPPLSEVRMADGKVADLERHGNQVALLRLDDGTSLTVPPEATGAGTAAKVGDAVVARYVENGTERVATLLRVIEVQTP